MSQEIRDFVTPSTELLALGEPTHQEPAFARIRNELLAGLAGHGVRSIALEIDRVAALTVNDYVQEGTGTLDDVLKTGFSHDFGALAGNRELVAWLRDHNEHRPPEERVTFHGFDAPMETTSAPSPRLYLEYVRDYLKLDLDLAPLVGEDDRWSRMAAVYDATQSVGDTAEAEKLRTIADDLLTTLYARAPELIAATTRAAWYRARTHLTAALGLLRYHKQAAQQGDERARLTGLGAIRDALMARNLLDIRAAETRRGTTLVFSHNGHLQRGSIAMRMADMDVSWASAGAIVASLTGARYTFVAGSLGRSDAIGLREPEVDTYEGLLQRRFSTWGLIRAAEVAPARTRTDTTPRQGYAPLDRTILDEADAVLHVNSGVPA